MPVLYRIVPDIHVLYYAGFGHCTGQELLVAERAAHHDPLREPMMLIIVDAQAVIELDIDLEDFRRGIEMNRQRMTQGQELEPTAFVLRKPLDQTVAETYAAFAEPYVSLKLAAFYGLTAALGWLGLAQHEQAITEIKQELHAQYARKDAPR